MKLSLARVAAMMPGWAAEKPIDIQMTL